MNRFFNGINFIFFRGIVYILSFISYNSKLFDVSKLQEVILSNKLMIYIKKYSNEIFIFILLILLILFGFLYLRKKIKEAREDVIEIKNIKKEEPVNLVMCIGTYLLPLLSSFYKISLPWMLVYELFIFNIYYKHINFHYRILMSFLYNGYLITTKNSKEFILFSNKSVNEINHLINHKTSVKFIRFGDNFYENDILFL